MNENKKVVVSLFSLNLGWKLEAHDNIINVTLKLKARRTQWGLQSAESDLKGGGVELNRGVDG